jgi:AcrR family transcriptional regulator
MAQTGAERGEDGDTLRRGGDGAAARPPTTSAEPRRPDHARRPDHPRPPGEPTEDGGAHRAASPEPVTPRGRRTRAQLIDAARRVFEEKGFVETRIGDITAEAAVAHGTFYTYFESKHELFREVVGTLVEDFFTQARSVPPLGDTPAARIERANRGYLWAYRRNARLMGVLEQAAVLDADVRAIRLEARARWVKRAEAMICRLQEDHVVAPHINPHYAANALGSMVDRFAFVWLVLGEPFDEDQAVETLTQLYCAGLGIERRPQVLH